ncbi:hypothetical protein FIV38_18640 [Pseudomonas proteolytica]|nr:hypothetical protein F4W61_14215 [Pseudomonas proteolytica]QHG25731.1 hypothetical protein GDV60_23865 [Pseudomonas sp. DTU12.1]TWR79106.1 hypothetical protein FIV38_18640 [Pseudomonas proteolytica]
MAKSRTLYRVLLGRGRCGLNVGAGLPAMQAPRSISGTEVMLLQASQLPQSVSEYGLPQTHSAPPGRPGIRWRGGLPGT